VRPEDGSEGMRYLFITVVVGGLGVGCATPRVSSQPQVSEEVERWQWQSQVEHERAEALAVRLAQAESALEAAMLERAESAQLSRLLAEELARAAAERHSLVEHNAQLVTRQRELAELQEELEDVWYQSALSRARRRSQPPASTTPESAGTSEGGSR
jgi:multidrug efflux pump subunit AcrA (membrane-fusion protein)